MDADKSDIVDPVHISVKSLQQRAVAADGDDHIGLFVVARQSACRRQAYGNCAASCLRQLIASVNDDVIQTVAAPSAQPISDRTVVHHAATATRSGNRLFSLHHSRKRGRIQRHAAGPSQPQSTIDERRGDKAMQQAREEKRLVAQIRAAQQAGDLGMDGQAGPRQHERGDRRLMHEAAAARCAGGPRAERHLEDAAHDGVGQGRRHADGPEQQAHRLRQARSMLPVWRSSSMMTEKTTTRPPTTIMRRSAAWTASCSSLPSERPSIMRAVVHRMDRFGEPALLGCRAGLRRALRRSLLRAAHGGRETASAGR